ncbi:MAG: hypothetical protein V4787_01340 [Pseudomonadota bacterium]
MIISRSDYQQLCRDASSRLHLFDTAAMGLGATFFVDDVECQLAFNEARGSAQLMCEMGDPKIGSEADVHRALLELQAAFVGQIDAMFVRDAINDRLLFTTRIPLHDRMTPANLAGALGLLTRQVQGWQAGVLAGAMVDYDHEFANRVAGNAGMSPIHA